MPHVELKFHQKTVGDKFNGTNIYGEAIYTYTGMWGSRGIIPTI